MNITAKSRYALKIMIDLANCLEEGKPQEQRHRISHRHGIPIDFMDQVLVKLRLSGLLVSTRGRRGGIALGKEPDLISLWDIISAVEEDHVYPVRCLESHRCSFEDSCISYDAWHEVFDLIKAQFMQKRLSELSQKWRLKNPQSTPNYLEVFKAQECASLNRPARPLT